MGKFKDFMGGTGAGLLNEASKNLAKNNMEITYIPRDEIYKNPKNEYSISDIENLADLIYVMGLREPLGVKPEGSGYKLIEGERRLTAIDKLIADGKWEGDIPCIIRISIHTSTREVTPWQDQYYFSPGFQSTLPQGK